MKEKTLVIILYLIALACLIYLGAQACGYLFRGVF